MTLASELDLQRMLTRERHRIHLIGVAAPAASLSFHELRAAVAEALRAMGEGR